MLLKRVKVLLPPTTSRGRLVRSLWRVLRDAAAAVSASAQSRTEVPVQIDASIPYECDILVQVDSFVAGGLENVVLDLNETLIAAGYKVVLLVLGTAGASVQRAHQSGMAVVIGSPDVKHYRAIIDRLNPHLLLTHYSLHGAELCHKRGIPFVQVIHNTYMWFNDAQRAAFARAARFTTAFVAVSEYAKRYSIRQLGIEETLCIVIPNGIDSAAFDAFDTCDARREIRAKHGLDDQDFVFLSVGSINHQKNHIATVRAFATMTEVVPHAKLVILGPAYEKSLLHEIQHFIVEYGLQDRVIYAGAAEGAQKYYAMADAFVTASFFEGGPLNQLEAVRANLPSVMADIGFASYFQGTPGCEIVTPPLDITEFCGAIEQLSSTPAFEEHLAAAMVRTYKNHQRPNLSPDVLESFDKSNAYRCYIELVEDLLHGKDVRGKDFPSSWPNRLTAVASESVVEAA